MINTIEKGFSLINDGLLDWRLAFKERYDFLHDNISLLSLEEQDNARLALMNLKELISQNDEFVSVVYNIQKGMAEVEQTLIDAGFGI